MEFKKVIEERYSCKSFDGRKADPLQLKAVLEAGRLAPTAKNLQEQHIYVVESPEGLAHIDAVTRSRYGAATCLVVAWDKNNVYTYPDSTRDSGIEDATIVATHMMLAAKDAGLDSCWLNNFNPDKLARLLNLPENEEILMILDLGYPAENSHPLPNHFSRKPLEQTVSYI